MTSHITLSKADRSSTVPWHVRTVTQSSDGMLMWASYQQRQLDVCSTVSDLKAPTLLVSRAAAAYLEWSHCGRHVSWQCRALRLQPRVFRGQDLQAEWVEAPRRHIQHLMEQLDLQSNVTDMHSGVIDLLC